MAYSVVIPNKYEDVIQPLVDSIKEFEPQANVIIVADNHTRNYGFNAVYLTYPDFIFSRSANAGILAAGSDDIILVNDDVRLLEPTFDKLQEIANSDPSIGILSPLVDGGCGSVFMLPYKVNELWNGQRVMYRPGTACDYLSFVCVYLKRALLNDIGLMDENFIHYGRDDADMCIRAVRANWKIAITRDLTVRHGSGGNFFALGKNWNLSFSRQIKQGNSDYFYTKYPDEPKRITWPHPFAGLLRNRQLGPDNWKARITVNSKIEQS